METFSRHPIVLRNSFMPVLPTNDSFQDYICPNLVQQRKLENWQLTP